jgi:uncharacterized protein HemX
LDVVGYVGRGQAGDGVVAIMIGLVLGLIGLYFWRIWKSVQAEEAFEKRYDEAEEYWSEQLRLSRERASELTARIEELVAEKDDLRGDIEELKSERSKILEVLAKNSLDVVDTL